MILRSTDVRAALRHRIQRQRGFFTLPAGIGAGKPADIVYSTWNPSDKDADVSLSGGNLIASINAANGAVRGVQGRAHTQNRYFEVTLSGADVNTLAGIGTSGASLASFPGADSVSYAGYPFSNQTYTNNASASNYITGSVVGVDVDFTAGTIRFIATPQQVSAAAFTSISGTLFPMWAPGTGSGGPRTGTINTGGSAFFWGLPPGATAWGGTWDSANKGAAVSLSGGDLIASVTGSTDSVKGTQSRSSGRYYFEVTYAGTGGDVCLIGVGNASASLSQYPGQNTNSWAYYRTGDQKYTNNTGSSIAKATTTVLGVHMNNGQVFYVVNGKLGGLANNLGSGTYYPMWGPGTSSGGPRTGTLNVGATAFAWSLPSGAAAWG
jgi:hypothetical protein